jgi:hypothetical protein
MTITNWLKKEIKQEGQLAVIASVIVASVTMTGTVLAIYYSKIEIQNDKINNVQTDMASVKTDMSWVKDRLGKIDAFQVRDTDLQIKK